MKLQEKSYKYKTFSASLLPTLAQAKLCREYSLVFVNCVLIFAETQFIIPNEGPLPPGSTTEAGYDSSEITYQYKMPSTE